MSRDYIILIGSKIYSCRNDENPITIDRSIVFISNEPILIKPKCWINFMKYTVNRKRNETNAYSLAVFVNRKLIKYITSMIRKLWSIE